MPVADAEAMIYDALATYVGDVAAGLGFDRKAVAYPNAGFDPPKGPGGKRRPYLSLTYMPNGSDLDGLPFDSDVTHVGLLQISVFWPAGEGIVKPMRVAAGIVEAFRPNYDRPIPAPGFAISIDRMPTVAGPMQESDLVQVPVTIRWRASIDAA